MSKSQIFYVKGMNMLNSQEEMDNDHRDLWDDRKLNEAYDKALKLANIEIAKRVAMSTNTNGDISHTLETSDHAKNKGKSSGAHAVVKSSHKREPPKWKVGMSCRALYEGDGLEYEACLVSIIDSKECVVKFLGYDNSEIVAINALKPSLGPVEQRRQIEEATAEKADDGFASQSTTPDKTEFTSDRAHSSEIGEQLSHENKKVQKKKKSHKHRSIDDLPEIPFHIPKLASMGNRELPLPPPPPMHISSDDRVESEEQALSSMLLSWYMSGYYTGLYQGMKSAKDNRKKVCKNS